MYRSTIRTFSASIKGFKKKKIKVKLKWFYYSIFSYDTSYKVTGNNIKGGIPHFGC